MICVIMDNMTLRQEKHIKTNNPEMLKSLKYKTCYLEEAKHIKRRNVWGGFWIGLAINIAVAVTLSSAN